MLAVCGTAHPGWQRVCVVQLEYGLQAACWCQQQGQQQLTSSSLRECRQVVAGDGSVYALGGF
jgi:hypothetical protein